MNAEKNTLEVERKTLPLTEVAQLMCLTPRRLRDLAEAGRIPGAIKLEGVRKWIFSRKALEKYIGVKLEEL